MPQVTDILAVLKPFADVARKLEGGHFDPEHTVFFFLGDRPGVKVKHFQAALDMESVLTQVNDLNMAAGQKHIDSMTPPSMSDTPNEPPQPLLERGGIVDTPDLATRKFLDIDDNPADFEHE